MVETFDLWDGTLPDFGPASAAAKMAVFAGVDPQDEQARAWTRARETFERFAAADRYPAPRWNPERGWRIDPALAYAHVIQESNFRAEAVSPAGAIGLMQVRPGTAGDTARARGEAFSASLLKRPETNLDLGQAYIELIRGSAATRGQLPKVIAAYNAGPVPVDRWNYTNDKGDPLLWIESIPYWETRYYVPAVLRNMWVYQGLAGAPQPTLRALSEHRWPTFPTSTTRLAH